MIFNTPPRLAFSDAVAKYVQTDLYKWFRNVYAGLLKLDLVENFESFRASNIVIAAGATVEITNALRTIPTMKLIVLQTGNGLVTDGVWDINVLRLINNGATTVTISVIFFR
jgi:hypothetical protein